MVKKIEDGVVQNFGSSAASYLESIVGAQIATRSAASNPIQVTRDALDAVFSETTLEERIVTYKVWSKNGTIVGSYNKDLEGRTFEVSEALAKAWQGEIVANFAQLELHAEIAEAVLGLPLLEVYVPIRDPLSREVVAVVEIYERAEKLADDLGQTRRETWQFVALVFLISGLVLFGIVHSASKLIDSQRRSLAAQLVATNDALAQNEELRKRITRAAKRSSSQTDRTMQRIGLDLHDGVAQHLSLIGLRLDGADLPETQDAQAVRSALSNAMTELRAISRGLALPDIDKLSLPEIARRAVDDHNRAYGAEVQYRDDTTGDIASDSAIRLSLYRSIQELLSNANKHANASNTVVRLSKSANNLVVEVIDDGLGFDTENVRHLQDDGGQGLIGLEDRLAPLGGMLDLTSSIGSGTLAKVTLPLREVEK